MKIFHFGASFDDAGDNTHKHVFPVGDNNWPARLREAMASNGTFEVKWSPDETTEGSLIGGLMYGFIGTRWVFMCLSQLMSPRRGMATLTGIGGDHVFVAPLNFIDLPTDSHTLPHMFLNIPQRDGCLVTELFRQEWLSRGFTGATFKEVGEMEDRLFVLLDPQSNPPVGT